MRVQMKTTMAGPAGCFQAGKVVELEDATAAELVERGYAVLVGKTRPQPEEAAEQPAEAAATEQPETAAVQKPRSRRGRE